MSECSLKTPTMNKPLDPSLVSPWAPNEAPHRGLRDALGAFATGVAVVTARTPDGRPVGLTVNSFNTVSLEPPLIVWSLSLSSPSLQALRGADHYAVNVLAADQRALSERFALRNTDKFAGLDLVPGLSGVPLLAGCCAYFECSNETHHRGGDHLVFIGRVERFSHAPKDPLVFHCGRYRALRDL